MNRVMLVSGILAFSFSAMGCDDRAPTPRRLLPRRRPPAPRRRSPPRPPASSPPRPPPRRPRPRPPPPPPVDRGPASPAIADASPPRPLAQHLTPVKRLVVARRQRSRAARPETRFAPPTPARATPSSQVENKDHARRARSSSFRPRPSRARRRARLNRRRRGGTWAFTREARDVGGPPSSAARARLRADEVRRDAVTFSSPRFFAGVSVVYRPMKKISDAPRRNAHFSGSSTRWRRPPRSLAGRAVRRRQADLSSRERRNCSTIRRTRGFDPRCCPAALVRSSNTKQQKIDIYRLLALNYITLGKTDEA